MSKRLVGVDALRGVAVVLMILDHGLIAFDVDHRYWFVRMTLTRASLPLFCLVAGALCKPAVNARREACLLGAMVPATFLNWMLGIGLPDIISLLYLGLVVLKVVIWFDRPWAWALVASAAAIQPATWPLGGEWTGYQPGVVMTLLVFGHALGRVWLGALGDVVPCRALFAWIGRYPLTMYVGHLAALVVAVAVVRR